MFNLLKTSDVFKKCASHLEIYGFVKIITGDDCMKRFSFGPLGYLLLENFKREWIHSNIMYRDHNVFLCDFGGPENILLGLKEQYKFAKDICSGEAPFGLAGISASTLNFPEEHLQGVFLKEATLLHHFTFLAPKEAEQFYYRWQQQRKRWWRLFSNDPSRFSFDESEGKEGAMNIEEARIIAKFNWGDHLLEKICYHGPKLINDMDIISHNIFSIRSNGKRSLPHVVESTLNLDMGVFTYMCDGFKQKKALKAECVFHRKLAPYKFGFAADQVSSEKLNDLLDLGKFLALGLSKAGISVLLPSMELGKKSLSIQLSKHSALGIPYTLVLHEETLTNGIAGLYSMRTTLQEDVHVGTFEEYAKKIMKNY